MKQHDLETIGQTSLSEDVPQRDIEEFSRRDRKEEALSVQSRLIELEVEHLRLQRLVAELLMKNQKLRAQHYDHANSSASATATCSRNDPSMERMHPSMEPMKQMQPSPR